jgi:hypothetical protein
MKTPFKLLAALCGLFVLGSTFAADPVAPVVPNIDPEADQLLRAAGAQLTAAKAFSFKAEIWEDALVADHKVSTTKTVEFRVRRPDRLQVEIRSPQQSRGFWYEGKSLTLLARKANLYGTVAAPATLDQLIDTANDQYGINFPLEDLLLSNPYASAMAGIKGGVSFGKVTVLGTACTHLAFSGDVVDLQLWIQDGPSPLVRKIVLTYKQEPGAPQYTAILSDWNLAADLSDAAFLFTPPAGSAKIEVLPAAANE